MTPPEFSAFVYGLVTGASAIDPQVALFVLRWILRDAKISDRYRDGQPGSIGIEAVLDLSKLVTIEKRK